MPLVSIVIPAYNAERTLGETIRAALDQTFADLEVIVVDDGSTDETAALAGSFGSPVQCISTENRGVSHARNEGISRARGDFVALLDADDIWEPNKLQEQMKSFERAPGAGMSFTGARRVDQEDRPIAVTPALYYPDYSRALLLYSSVITAPCSSTVTKRALIRDVGFDSRFSQCADWDFVLRLSRLTQFIAVDKPLVRYRTGGGQMSSDIGLLERDTFAVLNSFYTLSVSAPYRSIRNRVYSNHWMIMAGSYLAQGKRRESLRCLLTGLKLHPANVRRPLGLPVRRLRRRLGADRAVA